MGTNDHGVPVTSLCLNPSCTALETGFLLSKKRLEQTRLYCNLFYFVMSYRQLVYFGFQTDNIRMFPRTTDLSLKGKQARQNPCL